MSDLISRQTAIDALEKILPANPMKSEYTQGITCGAALAIEYVKQLPSAQPEIIACGDCKHWICHDKRCGYWNHGVKPLDFCSRAERREE